MPPEPAGSPGTPRSLPVPGAHPEVAPERCGTVAVARYVKDDGRALILYTHVEASPA